MSISLLCRSLMVAAVMMLPVFAWAVRPLPVPVGGGPAPAAPNRSHRSRPDPARGARTSACRSGGSGKRWGAARDAGASMPLTSLVPSTTGGVIGADTQWLWDATEPVRDEDRYKGQISEAEAVLQRFGRYRHTALDGRIYLLILPA